MHSLSAFHQNSVLIIYIDPKLRCFRSYFTEKYVNLHLSSFVELWSRRKNLKSSRILMLYNSFYVKTKSFLWCLSWRLSFFTIKPSTILLFLFVSLQVKQVKQLAEHRNVYIKTSEPFLPKYWVGVKGFIAIFVPDKSRYG